MFINGDGNWVENLNEYFKRRNLESKPSYAQPKFRVGDYIRNADQRSIFSKGCSSNWKGEVFKGNNLMF